MFKNTSKLYFQFFMQSSNTDERYFMQYTNEFSFVIYVDANQVNLDSNHEFSNCFLIQFLGLLRRFPIFSCFKADVADGLL